MTVAIGGTTAGNIKKQLSVLMSKADAVDMAVSYIQVSGWKEIAPLLRGVKADRIRIVCTDQMGITDPAAVRLAQAAGVKIQRYTGPAIYHPKVYLAAEGAAKQYVIGSANLSASALERSVEVVATASDDGTLSKWFEDLFTNQSEPFTTAHLDAMQKAVAARVKGQLAVQSALKPAGKAADKAQDVGAKEPLDTILGALPNEIGMLNYDHAGNNVRTLADARGKLGGALPFGGKVRSEFGMLGLAVDGSPTPLGTTLAASSTDADFADKWVKWLHDLAPANILASQYRLVRARSVLRAFWKLQPEVRQYFLDNAESPAADVRPVLQTIELLSNVGSIAEALSLENVRQLSSLLKNPDLVPINVRETVRDYLTNKGTRGWKTADRRLIPTAWKKAAT
jgi:HKD family nuclease